MSNSLISNEKKCFVCDTTLGIHKHHIFFGTANRKLSEKYGCWVYLCGEHHNLSNAGVHFNRRLDLLFKRECQKRWEQQFGTREDFIKIFGRNYCEEG